jgi:hypothetical protein
MVILAGCHKVDMIEAVPEKGFVSSENDSEDVIENDPTMSSSETIESEKFRQIYLENEYQVYVNWIQNNEIYTIKYDVPNAKTDFVMLKFSDEEIDASVENVLSPGISSEMKSWLIENSAIELVYILASSEGDKYLLIGATASEERSWGDNYIISMYDQENGYKNIIGLESDLQYVCPLYHLDPSSVSWLAGDKYLYMRCSVEFGDLIIDIDNRTYYTFGFDTRCPYAVFPVFSKNGELVIANEAIYHTEDYLDYLEQCLRPDLDSMLDEDFTTELLNELEKKKIIDTPAQLWFDYELYRIDYEGKYYYFHEIGNGEYNDTNEGNIARLNIETGDIETIISSKELEEKGIAIGGLVMYISPDGDQLLLRNININWEYIYIYNIEKKNR